MTSRDPDPPVRSAPGREREASAPDEARFPADPVLLAAGWERRFVIDGPRVGDIVRLYESLGFDVLAEAVPAEDAGDDCRDCRIIALQGFRTIYTRPRAR